MEITRDLPIQSTIHSSEPSKQSTLTAQETKTDNLSTAIFNAFSEQHNLVDNRLRDFISLQQENNKKMKALQNLKQLLRNGGDLIDWTQDPSKKALLDECKSYGLITKEDQYKFTKDESEALLLNIDSTMDRYLSSSEETKLRMSQFANYKTQIIELWSNLMKRVHEDAMAVARNIGR